MKEWLQTLFLLTTHLNSVCIIWSFNSCFYIFSTTRTHPSPAWHGAQLLVNYRKCDKHFYFFARWTYLFASGGCSALMCECWIMATVLCADIYFHNVFFWLGTKHLPPVERQIVWNELSRSLCCLIPPLFSSSLSCPGLPPHHHHPLTLCFCQSLHLSFNTPPLLVSLSLVFSGTVRKWYRPFKRLFFLFFLKCFLTV